MRRSLPLVIVVIFVSFGIAWAGETQQENEQAAIPLTASSSKTLPLPSFSHEIGPQCDSNGNLYFRTGFGAKRALVLRVDSRDGSTTVYRPSDSKAAGADFISFHVTPAGRIAILLSGIKGEPYVYQFEQEDPANPVRVILESPDGLSTFAVQSFFVLPNEHFILQGYFSQKAPKGRKGRGYLAEFAPSGKLIRLSLDKVSNEVLKAVANRGAKTAVAQSPEGVTYLLEADRIVVLSAGGDIIRQIKLISPEPGDTPDALYMYKGQLIIGFYHSEGRPGKVTRVRFALLDPMTGERIRLYDPATELGQDMVCLSDEGFTFMRDDKGHVKLVNAAIK